MTDARESVNAARRRPRRFAFDAGSKSRYTHYLFRYPAKFHPPVARELLEMFSQRGALCSAGGVREAEDGMQLDVVGSDAVLRCRVHDVDEADAADRGAAR